METLQERKQYWGNNFTEQERFAIAHIVSLVDRVDTDREPLDFEDNIKLKMIRKWKQDTEKLWEYLIKHYST